MKKHDEFIIPEDLKDIDDRCMIWARVTADRPHYLETMLFKAMVQYGGYKPEDNPDDPEPPPPLSRAQTLDGWLIDRAWRSPLLIQPHKNILMLWYQSPYMDAIFAAKILRCRVRDVRHRLRAALVSIRNVAEHLRATRDRT